MLNDEDYCPSCQSAQKQKYRSLRRSLLSDVHSPAKWRIGEFDEAFGVTPGDAMWIAPEYRVHIR